jgi:phosphoribosylanthranilate isomerase
VLVKVCGITNGGDALMALRNGADAVGVIVDVPVETPRKISVGKAKAIKNALKDVSHTFITVLMPESVEDVVKVVGEVKPHGIQLHGNESPEFVGEVRESIDAYIIKAVHADDSLDYDYVERVAEHADMILVDTKAGGKVGGTGVRHDWSIDLEVKRMSKKPLIASGGLNGRNVGGVILKVWPYAVDVSSGIESRPGVKDEEKFRKFMRVVDEYR